jgi:hypothetical protein
MFMPYQYETLVVFEPSAATRRPPLGGEGWHWDVVRLPTAPPNEGRRPEGASLHLATGDTGSKGELLHRRMFNGTRQRLCGLGPLAEANIMEFCHYY